jgi:nucleoside-diphosphate-sugar epimerase
MRVFIAGASGALGRRLVRQFVARGHSVIGLARSPKAEITLKEAGGEPRHADLFDAESLARAA